MSGVRIPPPRPEIGTEVGFIAEVGDCRGARGFEPPTSVIESRGFDRFAPRIGTAAGRPGGRGAKPRVIPPPRPEIGTEVGFIAEVGDCRGSRGFEPPTSEIESRGFDRFASRIGTAAGRPGGRGAKPRVIPPPRPEMSTKVGILRRLGIVAVLEDSNPRHP
jgi:hypothetical protein